MRIALLSWESMYSIALGGLAPHITELAGGLSRRGHDVHIFTRLDAGQSRYDFIDGVHYHRCVFDPHTNDFLEYVSRMCDSFVWHLKETEAFNGWKFDVVHGHDWMTTNAAAHIKNVYGTPLVMTIHSTEYGRCGNCHWEDDMSQRIRDLEWEAAYIANRLICVSKTLKKEVEMLYHVPKDKVSPVYNGVNAFRYDRHVDVKEVRTVNKVGLDDPFVFFAGRLTWQKGPDLLVEAIPGVLDRHPQTKFLLAGDGDMRPGLEDRSRELRLNGAIQFLGQRKSDELVNYFKSSDFVCVPSRNEPFGIVILEAWSASKPVVATNIGGPMEFVHDDHNGYKVDAEVENISAGLNKMLENKEGAKQMGLNGRREAESLFSWGTAAAATETVYEQAMA